MCDVRLHWQVLCKYIQISCAALSEQQQRTELALAACAATVAALAAQQQRQQVKLTPETHAVTSFSPFPTL